MPEPEQVGKVVREVLADLPLLIPNQISSRADDSAARREIEEDKEYMRRIIEEDKAELSVYRAAVQARPDAYYFDVPTMYERARLADFGSEYKATDLTKRGLFINGAAGVGKTHLATAFFWENLHRAAYRPSGRYEDVLAEWATAPDVLLRLRATFNGQGNESDVVKELADVRLLVLDDLGAERQSEWTALALYTILSRRVNWMRPTIVTSNLTLDEIDAADPRLASRLGGMAQITLTGADRRLAAIGERTDAATADRTARKPKGE